MGQIRFIVILVALFVASGLPAWAQNAPADATLVVVDAVTREPLSQTFSVIGRIVASQRGVVAARTQGSVAEMRARVGDRVHAGDVLAVLDRDRLVWRRDLAKAQVAAETAGLANAEARLDVARARVATAEAKLVLAEQELGRLEKLRKSAAFSQARHDDLRQEAAIAKSEVDEAKAEVLEAKSNVDQSRAGILRTEANLRLAEDDLVNTEVRAPFDGVVTLRHTEAGAFVEIGDDVVTLVNDQKLEIEADVPYNRLGGLAPGVEVGMRLDDRSHHAATVRAVGVEENPKSRTRPVRFTPAFNDSARNLANGQSAILDLPIDGARSVVSVHKDAVIRNQGLAMVYVVVGGVAEARVVELGESIGARFEVLSGLEPGELVVIRGNERLMPGQAVTYDKASS
jgi:multidrug resistance efflux pump